MAQPGWQPWHSAWSLVSLALVGPAWHYCFVTGPKTCLSLTRVDRHTYTRCLSKISVRHPFFVLSSEPNVVLGSFWTLHRISALGPW